MIDIVATPLISSADPPGRPPPGRRHLDGSSPGAGSYLTGVTVSLPQSDVAALEAIGNGNRSAAVRLLLEVWRERNGGADDGKMTSENRPPAREEAAGAKRPRPARAPQNGMPIQSSSRSNESAA